MNDKNNSSSEVFSGDIPPGQTSIAKEIWEWTYTILLAVIITLGVKYFLFDFVKVDGPSMIPTLMDNDRLLVTKCGYKPKAGDIVILDSRYDKRVEYMNNEKGGETFISKYMPMLLDSDIRPRYYVKRVIALPGQTIDFSQDGKVLIDGKVLNESEYYDGVTHPSDPNVKFPYTVPENKIFVMGDNRSVSKDSRSGELGAVDYESLMGKGQFRVWPLKSFGSLYK